MKTALALIFLAAMAHTTFAGRAFPVEAENFAVSTFQKINPYIEWDPTNFLVDASGPFAICDYVGQKGSINVDRVTPDGDTVGGLTDYIAGSGTDSDTVTGYIELALASWINTSPFYEQIVMADRFGCSVQPGCSGYAVIACLFSPGASIEPTPPNPTGTVEALAFTEDQYELAEFILGVSWDRSHYIENLSGFETTCSMIYLEEWDFAHAKEDAGKRGMTLEGKFGSAPNRGETEDAMIEILYSWIDDVQKFNNQVGCSIIPDCDVSGRGDQSEMYVVISCLFSV